MMVKSWLDGWGVSGSSKSRARNLIGHVMDLAMLWGWIPTERNQMSLVRVRQTKRVREQVVLSPEQFRELVDALDEPYSTMVVIAGALGLRVSELLALHWGDIDFKERTITLKRAFTHGRIGVMKTESSAAVLPLDDALAGRLKKLPKTSELLFPSPTTGLYFSDSTILSKKLKPVAKELGLGNIGWHTFRHSYRSWLDGQSVPIGAMKNLMRHSDVSMTMNQYGRALPQELREGNSSVVRELLKK
jgi:integrase